MGESLLSVVPIHNRLLVGIYDDGETSITLGGKKFFLLDDTNFDPERDRNKKYHDKHAGIRDRWAVVIATSDSVAKTGSVKPGDKVLLEFGQWSRGIPVELDGEDTRLWSIDFQHVLGTMSGGFTDLEMEQITRLYPTYEHWHTETLTV